jgi:salicylate hydroxylase
MHNNAPRNLALIGGGIGGLTAALAFARQGAAVTVYEQAPALTEVGAGLQIAPNGMRALYALGLEKALSVTGVQAQAVIPMDALTGRDITRFDLSAQTPPYRFFHRAALIDLLARACAANGVTVQLNAKITDVQVDGSFTAAGTQIRPNLTMGADGLHSVVRGVINKPATPFFTGQVAWRALVKTKDPDPVARIWMAPGRHIVTYPLSGGRLNIVAVQQRSQWADEGWNHADEPGNLRHVFEDCHWSLKSILADVDKVNLWGLFRHPVAQRWQRGSIAILGDAAHPTLPFLAQGANLAIEDAYVLARNCDAHETLDTGLRLYQQARRDRVIRAIKAANANARNYHFAGVKRRIAHGGLRTMGAVAPNAFLNRLSWLYDFDVSA